MLSWKGCCGLHKVAAVLVLVGALNWGLVAIGGEGWNLVDLLLGQWELVERIVYGLVGLSAVLMLAGCWCKACKK